MTENQEETNKVRIPQNWFKHDILLLNQQLDISLEKALVQFELKCPSEIVGEQRNRLKDTLKRRLNYYILHCKQKLKTTLALSKDYDQKKQKKVVMEFDINLIQSNNIKLQLLKKGIQKSKSLIIPKAPFHLKVEPPKQLYIIDNEGRPTNFKDAKQKLRKKYSIDPSRFQKIAFVQKLLVQGVNRLDDQRQTQCIKQSLLIRQL